MAKHKLASKLIEIRKPRISPGKWKFGSRDVSGQVYDFNVVDHNFDVYKKWVFQIRVPNEWRKGTYIQVIVTKHPQRRCWADLERRSITFSRCTKIPYQSNAYAKVTLADPLGNKNKIGVNREQRAEIRPLLHGFRLMPKRKVTTSNAPDKDALVVVVKPDDHKKMIRFFMVVKAWVLYQGFTLED